MGLLKTFALTGGVVLTTAFGALAADLAPPPPPMPAAPVPLRGSIDQSGVYLRGDVGMGMMGSTNVRYMDPNGVLGASTITMRQGELGNVGFAGIGVGYQLNSWFRFDVTGELRGTAKGNFGDSYANAVNTGTNALFGNISSSVFLANAYVDMGNFHGFTPFLGAGIGMARHRVSNIEDVGLVTPLPAGPSGPSSGNYASKTKTSLAWAVMAGVGYDVTPNVKLELGYRYLNMGKADSGPGCVTCPAGVTIRYHRLDSHDIKFGMRWMLGGPEPAPAPMGYPAVVSRRY